MSDKRTFKIVHVAAPGQKYKSKSFSKEGIYKGTSPQQAAKKAFSKICQQKKVKGVCTLTVTIRESTQGSNKDVYSYRLSRKKKTNPEVVMFPSGPVVYKYDITVEDLNKNSYSDKKIAGIGRPRSNSTKSPLSPSKVLESLLGMKVTK